MLPFQTLDAVTSTGPGEAFDLGSDPADHFSVEFVIETAPTSSPWTANYVVQGSLDGGTWFNLGFVTVLAEPPATGSAGSISASSAQTSVAQWCTAGNYQNDSISPLARFARVNLTAVSGDAGPFTASAWLAAGQPT
jgi:hypothetical protein